MRTVVLVLAALAALPMPARAVEHLDGEAIKRAFEGNTVAGRYSGTNQPFSEYHHPDGRAIGHNRGLPNRDACWTTTDDAVCYYYGPQETRRTYCFTVERSERLYVLRSRPSGRINGVATVEPGDATGGIGADMPAWTCDGLISRAPGGAASGRQLAMR